MLRQFRAVVEGDGGEEVVGNVIVRDLSSKGKGKEMQFSDIAPNAAEDNEIVILYN